MQSRWHWASALRPIPKLKTDKALEAFDILPEIVDAVHARAQTAVGGGYLRDRDVVKAMALGADAVGIGKLVGY